MYKLIIRRLQSNEYGTFGKAYLHKGNDCIDFFYTLEPSGEPTSKSGLNRPIPFGTYNARFRYSPKFSPKLNGLKLPILSNDEVSEERFILIHQGNYKKDTQGCILLGICLMGDVDSYTAISNSKVAIQKLCKLLNNSDFIVEVVDE